MNSNELFEEFLKHCNDYEMDLYGAVLKNEDTLLKVQKPFDPEKNNFLIYQLSKGNARLLSKASDLNELLELCREEIGEDSVTKSYGYY